MTRQGKANIGHLPAFEDKARLITAPFCQNAPALRSALEEEEEGESKIAICTMYIVSLYYFWL